MASWRDSVLQHFQPGICRLTIVSDPDGLLTEERMLSAIKDRGFDLIPFDDPLAFRFAYESQYRSLWDDGQQSSLVVVLRCADPQLDQLPFDLLKAGRPIVLALHQFFPKLNYPVLAALDRSFLDSIDEALVSHDGGSLTENSTRDFVLLHCFRIVPAMLRTPVDLMKALLSLHSRRVQLPAMLVEHLLERLSRQAVFQDWPLRSLLQSRDGFLSFVQSQWQRFLQTLPGNRTADGMGTDVSADDGALVSDTTSESLIPFEHEDVRAYVDTLFLDGSLTPLASERNLTVPTWAETGVIRDAQADSLRRYAGLREQLELRLPSEQASHRDWQELGQLWAELTVLRWRCDECMQPDDRDRWQTLQDRVECEFAGWMLQRYGTLHNLPHQSQPVMVHHIPRYLAFQRRQKSLPRVALLVMDGLALDQWLLLRRELDESTSDLRFHESTAFAWVPTLTSVTRQAIFAGEPPLYFPDSLGSTSRERAHWRRFWEDQGVPPAECELVTSISSAADADLDLRLSDPRIKVLGVVWNIVDDIMHGMQMQTAGMHNQVRLWAEQGHLQALLQRLHDEGFTVYLTADHGNVTATGIGIPREGVLAETRGKRCRVYQNEQFREEVASQFAASIRWPGFGLPQNHHVLLPQGLTAFSSVDERIVGHGGIALEEVLVPFVTISREAP